MVSPNRAEEHQFPQGSFYNLTIDQLGNVGKPLNTIKLDELFKNVISVEEGQLLQNVNPSSSSSSCSSSVSSSASSSASFFLGNFDLNGLEDFLIRAGVINIGNQNALLNIPQPIMAAIDPMVVVSQQAEWLQMAAVQRQQQQMTVLDSNLHVSESSSVYEKPMVFYSENQLGMNIPVPAMSGTTTTTTSSESQAAAAEKKRRYSDEIMEKTIERRQKRMIKNRESAARSRARKQAYTNQLEHEVFHLRKTNTWLKKLKEVETFLSSDLTPMPRYQLRRTSSASF